jgi:DNA repair protein RadC
MSSLPASKEVQRNITTEISPARYQRIADFEGPAALGDDELLTLLLGRGGRGLHAGVFARTLLEEAGGLARLARLRTAGLLALPGLGRLQATKLAAAFELGRRVERDSTRQGSSVPLSKERVVAWAAPRLAALDHEEVWVLCVNAQSALRSTWQVGRGGIHGCGLLARDLLIPVVRDAASGFVLVHNHPSGDPTPSREDIEMTRALQLAATVICIPLLDHVVVARGGAQSFFELGLLEV